MMVRYLSTLSKAFNCILPRVFPNLDQHHTSLIRRLIDLLSNSRVQCSSSDPARSIRKTANSPKKKKIKMCEGNAMLGLNVLHVVVTLRINLN